MIIKIFYSEFIDIIISFHLIYHLILLNSFIYLFIFFLDFSMYGYSLAMESNRVHNLSISEFLSLLLSTFELEYGGLHDELARETLSWALETFLVKMQLPPPSLLCFQFSYIFQPKLITFLLSFIFLTKNKYPYLHLSFKFIQIRRDLITLSVQ